LGLETGSTTLREASGWGWRPTRRRDGECLSRVGDPCESPARSVGSRSATISRALAEALARGQRPFCERLSERWLEVSDHGDGASWGLARGAKTGGTCFVSTSLGARCRAAISPRSVRRGPAPTEGPIDWSLFSLEPRFLECRGGTYPWLKPGAVLSMGSAR
jgi:hypothetical protein